MPTYYVNASATGAADGSSEADAFTTVGAAAAVVAAGDTVWIKASATYSENVVSTTAGTNVAVIWWRGYATTPGDGGKATISASAAGNTFSCGSYYCFENLIFTNGTSHGLSGGANDYIACYNCEFISNGNGGVAGDNQLMFVNCIAHTNSSVAFQVDSSARWVGCVIYGNGGVNDSGAVSAGMYKCLCYNNTAHANANFAFLIGCTFDGEGGAGDLTGSMSNGVVAADNLFHDTTGTACDMAVASLSHPASYFGNNMMSSVTTDYGETEATMLARGFLVGYQDVTATDPKFIDEANDDYNLQHQSPAASGGVKPGGIT